MVAGTVTLTLLKLVARRIGTTHLKDCREAALIGESNAVPIALNTVTFLYQCPRLTAVR